MDINQIILAIQKSDSISEFEGYLKKNLSGIIDYYYGLSNNDMIQQDVANFYDQYFVPSRPFLEFTRTTIQSDLFLSFIFIQATFYERYAKLTSLIGVLDHLQSILPTSSLKFRLRAISKINDVNNTKVDYINNFHSILNILNSAFITEDEDFTVQIADILIYYYKKGHEKLLSKGYAQQLTEFKQLFVSAINQEKFPFLSYPTIQNVVNNVTPYNLTAEATPIGILQPSSIIQQLFELQITNLVKAHPKTYWHKILLGYSFNDVRIKVLEKGRADFNLPFESLSVNEKVLLYCHANMRKHFFTSYAIFSRLKESILGIFSKTDISPIFIDLGCGPMTSGLALADFFFEHVKSPIKMVYLGIDRAPAMIRKAKLFAASNLFGEKCHFDFFENWNEITIAFLKDLINNDDPIFINASYLFASTSLPEYSLAYFISSLKSITSSVFFIFQNPGDEETNLKYYNFKEHLSFNIKDQGYETFSYKTTSGSSFNAVDENVFFEVLEVL